MTLHGTAATQILVQLLGIVSAFVYTCSVSWVIFWIVDRWIGLRVPIVEEDGGRADPLLGDYDGRLRVTVLRNRGWWSRFRPFPEYMRDVQHATPAPRYARLEVANSIKSGKAQFIRDDNTEASETDVNHALDEFFS